MTPEDFDDKRCTPIAKTIKLFIKCLRFNLSCFLIIKFFFLQEYGYTYFTL